MPTATPHLLALFDAMLNRQPVTVHTDMYNGAGELTKPAGWTTLIREIRRPAQHIDAYGHLEAVIVVEGDPHDPNHGKGLSCCFQPDQIVPHD